MAYFEKPRLRVAPSPTGDPHVGTAYIALFNLVYARSKGGKFILRLEDTDRARRIETSEAAISHSLEWLGLQYDEGPDVGGDFGPYRQSERLDIYARHVQELVDKGNAYRCFCTKERLDEARSNQRTHKLRLGYDGHCRTLDPADSARRADAGEEHVVRLRVPQEGKTSFRDEIRREEIEFENAEIDDQVLLKADGWPTYHLASVVDDHLMKISHVVRAEEWITSTPKHVLLYQAFDWPMPKFYHMSLLRNPDKSKISKRKLAQLLLQTGEDDSVNPTSLEYYESRGYLQEALLNFLALMGWSMGDDQEKFTLDQMIEHFSWDRVKPSEPVFDLKKLDWLNGQYLRELSQEDLCKRLIAGGFTTEERLDAVRPVLSHIQERLKVLSEFNQLTEFLVADNLEYDASELLPKKKNTEETADILSKIKAALKDIDWQSDTMESAMVELANQLEWKNRDFFAPIRVAITGSMVSPPLFPCVELIGRGKCLARLDAAITKLSG
ncbi:MAG: glutamate--tRNA ligase [Planctomycetota bacterium]|nr:glutamate--tRNA ligase [Planctomycetota bacterium]